MEMLEQGRSAWTGFAYLEDLPQATRRRMEQGDSVGQRDGFVQVVRDHDDGPAALRPEAEQFFAQVGATGFVHGGERFIEQEDVRGKGKGAGQRHTLTHAAGQLGRVKVSGLFQLCHAKGFHGSGFCFAFGQALRPQTVGRILQGRVPGEDGVILKNGDPVRPGTGDGLVVFKDGAAGGQEEASDEIEQGGLSAPAGAGDDEEFPTPYAKFGNEEAAGALVCEAAGKWC